MSRRPSSSFLSRFPSPRRPREAATDSSGSLYNPSLCSYTSELTFGSDGGLVGSKVALTLAASTNAPPRPRWTSEEEQQLVRHLAQSSGSLKTQFRSFHDKVSLSSHMVSIEPLSFH